MYEIGSCEGKWHEVKFEFLSDKFHTLDDIVGEIHSLASHLGMKEISGISLRLTLKEIEQLPQ